MIVTLTPNPSVDRAIVIESLDRGEVHRATSSRIDPGGKGVNVSRALSAQGARTCAVFPTGGPEGHLLEDLLTAAKVPTRTVAVKQPIRMNISILEPDGTTTKLNEPGPALASSEVSALLNATLERAGQATWVVGCGSLPPSVPDNIYADLVAQVRHHGLRVAVDTSDTPLAAAAAAHPHLIKPNREELAELICRDLHTFGDVYVAARELVDGGIETVAVSLGIDGALLVTSDQVIHAQAFITTPLSTVGAGDCMLAGLLHGLSSGHPPADALAAAVTWGAAAVTLSGSQVPLPKHLRNIPVDVTHTPDLTRPLGS